MASIVFHGTSNKRKNRINSARLFDFGNPEISGNRTRCLSGAFRDNIRNFLQNFGKIEDYTISEMEVWCTALVSENDGVLPLYVMEETVENSIDPFCEHCELSGWGHHFVCKRRYHFIIPFKQNWNMPLDEDFGEMNSSYLYGIIHSNGYGHLIAVDSLKENPQFTTADDSMVLWDRLCTVLKVRSISAHNFLRNEAIDRNLIFGTAYGKSWFEKWGYKFSPGITESKYKASIRFLGSLSLDILFIEVKKNKKIADRIHEMICMYRKLSDAPLVTVGDLLRFMLVSQSRTGLDISNYLSKFGTGTGDRSDRGSMGFRAFVNSMTTDCRWSSTRLEHVVLVIVDLLKEHKVRELRSMSRQELRDEARKSIGDTGLIDFVLKSIKSFSMDNLIIRRTVNPFSRLAEFTVHERSDSCSGSVLSPNFGRDARFLCEFVLEGYPQHQEVVFGNNVFLKDWSIKGDKDKTMKLSCKVLPSFEEMETELIRALSPGEVVVVEPWITIGELKSVAEIALRDTYCIMDGFEVSQIGGLRRIEEGKVLSSVFESGEQVWVRGRGLDLRSRLRYEDGGGKKRF